MIRNLNQVSFQGFGNVPPERNQSAKLFEKSEAVSIPLSQENTTIYSAKADTWVTFDNGISVLSVSHDGENYQHFYLDKPVCIKPGVQFAISPFMGEASALLYSKEAPEQTGVRSSDSLRVDRQFRVESIYTFWYQEKEQGFLFPGEAHPMAELTYVDQGALHSVADGQDLLLKQGDLVIYGPGQWHMQYADIGVAPRFVTISFELHGMELAPLMNRKFTAPQNVVSLLQNMLREQDRMDPFSNEIILSQLNLLLLFLLRETAAPRGGKLQTSNAIHFSESISICVGSFVLFVCDVMAAAITVGLYLFPISFCIIRTGLIPPCSEPTTGLKSA